MALPLASQNTPTRPTGIDIATARKAVVTVQALDADGRVLANGTGFFVIEGHIFTAAHVLEGATGCRVELNDKQQQRCSVTASDTAKDVAVLSVSGVPPGRLRWGSSESANDGDEVTVISNPLGQLPGTISRGIISASRVVKGTKLLQISAPISHGSSGGPVLNSRGEVIGIVRSTISEGQSLNFATASDAVRNLSTDQTAVAEGLTLLAPKNVLSVSATSSRVRMEIPQLSVGQSISGTLTSADSLYPDNSYFKIYQFTAPGPRNTVTIDLSSDDFDPVLIVRGDDLDASVINDDGGPGCSARISRAFPSRGPYRILVNTTSDPEKQTGRFSLSIRRGSDAVQTTSGNTDCEPPQPPTRSSAVAGAAAAHAIAIGQTQQGSLSRSDVLLTSDSTYAQPWTIQGRAGTTITIDLESDAFDAYLFLRGPGIAGGRDFQDDDSGGNCHARLTATFPQTAAYEIVVNTADHYATGAFSLSVTSGSKPKSVARCNRNSQ
jgi:serine protease Do